MLSGRGNQARQTWPRRTHRSRSRNMPTGVSITLPPAPNVTHDDLAAMVKRGEDVVVHDAKGEDITRSVLTQIVFEQENKEGQGRLSANRPRLDHDIAHQGREPEYRIKSANEPYERVATESELSKA